MYNVMIVDDEPIIRFGIKASVEWEQADMRVIGDYANGAEALQAMEQSPVDILITDIKMPLMDGLVLTKKAMERLPYLKVILVSSYNDFEYVREGIRLGAIDYILKPTLEPEELLNLCQKSIAKIEKEKRLEQDLTGYYQYIQQQAKEETEHNQENVPGHSSIMKQALAYIHQHYTKDLTLQQVADEVHVSKNYFSILFKKEKQQNFIDYVIHLRIDHARKLLEETDLKIYEIAEQAGFNDVKYFSKLFKKVTGCSPIDYRDQQNSP